MYKMIYTYKGYRGTVNEVNTENSIYHGRVINISKDVITFQAKSIDHLEEEFKISVDVYLDLCNENGDKPEKPIG